MVLSSSCHIQVLCGHAPKVLSVAVQSGAVVAHAPLALIRSKRTKSELFGLERLSLVLNSIADRTGASRGTHGAARGVRCLGGK